MWNVLCLSRAGKEEQIQRFRRSPRAAGDSHHMARGRAPLQLGRKRINVAARGPRRWDLERGRSVFGLLHNPWPALQMDLGISGLGKRRRVGIPPSAWRLRPPLSPCGAGCASCLKTKLNPRWNLCFLLGTAAEEHGQHRVPAAQD